MLIRVQARRDGRSLGAVRSLGLAAVVLAGAAACGDSTAPWSEFEPERVASRLDAVLEPLAGDGDFLMGLDLAVATLTEYGGGWLADAVAHPGTTRDGMLQGLRPTRRGAEVEGGDAPSAFTIPQGFAGETLEWDPSYGYRVSGRTGAPFNGVRIFLYRMSWTTGYPVEPLSRIGYVDLIESDGADAEGVRVRAVSTVGPDRVMADYRVSLTGAGSYEEGSMVVLARGFVALAGSVDIDLTQRTEWSRSRDREELELDYRYRQGTRSVVLEGVATTRYDAAEWATFDFSTALAGERPTTEVGAVIESSGTVRGEILSDGRRVVRIGGYEGEPRFERADGGQLSWSEMEALERIWAGITDLVWWTEWVVIPADLLLLGG